MLFSHLAQMLIVLLIVLSGGGTVLPAQAQEGDALRFFQQNPGSSRLFFRQEAPRRPAPVYRAPSRSSEDAPVRRRAAPRVPGADGDVAVVPPQTDVPAVLASIFISVIGDSLSDNLANGLRDYLADKPEFAVVRRSKSSSGLVRDDYHDWPKVLREVLAGPDKVDLVVVLLGSNDRQALRDETGSHDFKSDRWRELYVKRVDDLIAAARDKRVPLLWVGIPVLESPRLSADMLYLNEIYKERTARANVPYVDVWEGFANDQNQYAATGPDVNGEMVRLRTFDGIHFTRAGSRKLGFFTHREVDRAISRVPGAAVAVALPQDLSEQIRRDTPGLTPNFQGTLTLPDELPGLPMIRERPLQGPVIELTALPSTPGGQLLRRRVIATSNEMTILVEQALAYGRLPPPKPGRADDQRWPGDRQVN